MKKPTKPTKKRPSDVNTRMHSILGDVIAISNQPIKAPKQPPRRQKGR